MTKSESQEEIASRFPDDGELVALWVSFLRANHGVEKADGIWSITQKGQNWIDKCDAKIQM
jgi:hypothetical protein